MMKPLAALQPDKGPCFWRPFHVTDLGPDHWGYSSWREMWMDFTVFTVARNPFDRAGSAFDYILGRRVRGVCCYDALRTCLWLPDVKAVDARVVTAPRVLAWREAHRSVRGAAACRLHTRLDGRARGAQQRDPVPSRACERRLAWAREARHEPQHKPQHELSARARLQGARKQRFGCQAPTFRQFTAQPFVLGVQDMLFKCGDHAKQAANFDFFHVEPASPCLFTPQGEPVFDFAIRCGAAAAAAVSAAAGAWG